jgi:hypothetical protein
LFQKEFIALRSQPGDPQYLQVLADGRKNGDRIQDFKTNLVMSELSKIDKAVATVNFILKKRRKLVDKMGQKVEVSENQKIYIGEELDLIRNVEVLLRQCQQNINIQLGKLPPQATDIEEAVLGAILLEEPAQEAIKLLDKKHFYLEAHQVIFEAVKRLWESDQRVDMRTVINQVKKNGMLEKIGGAGKIAELTSKVSSTKNINYHAHILIEMAIKRELIVMGGRLVADGYEESADALEMLDEAQEQLQTINSWIK